MTHYIYKGEEITHIDFIDLCKRNGIQGGPKWSTYDRLADMAEKGVERAVNIMKDLEIRKTPNPERPITFLSPRNRYLISVYFPKAIKGVGSCVSFGSMTLDNIEKIVRRDYMYNLPVVRVFVDENMKKYPEFEWKKVKAFDVVAY